MTYILKYIRRYPLSVVCISIIWILSFVPFFPETPLDNVEFIDKWIHIIMYGGAFTVVWIEYASQHHTYDYEKLFFWAWLMPIAMSGMIELLQEYCSGGRRSGEWLDLAANSTGVTVAAIIGLAILFVRSRS